MLKTPSNNNAIALILTQLRGKLIIKNVRSPE
jgi:hypothetical protein